ncbi:HEAT repeat domain-containing protein [Streptomyces sp. PKU-EA00015]|uniref:HEAT repeat domain-containing protein n=1 Tax=Streptomyces sp. PKU-EA00015 TaxID=2748326 RepID=UPI0015A03FDD|nr:HEAT repeat domain-containing protein [Streptomyces sp. PKU-EA00015]NWF25889.1 HEAT repeat domain-containing protein [Streptomyces sp. PKU-EA00015]
MTDFTERLVIKPSFTSDDVDFVSMQRGWVLQKSRIPEAGAYVDVWVTLDRKTEIHQVDDQPIGTRYFTLRGSGAEEVAQEIHEDCELWSVQEALSGLHEADDRDEKLRCVYAAALAADEADAERITGEFRNVTRDPDAGVRQAVIIATGYFPHPGLVDLVRELRDSDPEEHVRENAQILLDGLSATD